MADDTAKPQQPPTNPDAALPWADIVKKAVQQSQAIAKALEPLAAVNRDAEGKEQKPIKDQAGLNEQTFRALKGEFRKRQKEHAGSYEQGNAAAAKAHTLRTRLEGCYKLALELAEDAQDCATAEQMLAQMYAKANAPKLQAKLDKARKAQERAAKRRADLEAQLKAS
jgi:hypothetical protein